jgi:hypothetical protein
MTSASDQIQAIHEILNEESDEEALKSIREVLYPADAHPEPVADKGLLFWANMIRAALSPTAGVELLDAPGPTMTYRFRGQIFKVTVETV